MAQGRSGIATVAGVLGALAILDFLLGPGLAYAGAVRPMTGFALFALGGLLGLLGLLVGLIGLARTGAASGRGGRGLAWLGVVAGSAGVLTLVVAALPGRGLPRINDITTDPSDPPRFVATARDPALADHDWSYPAEFAEQQFAAYPDLDPILLDRPRAQVFQEALAAARSLGWEIVDSRPQEGVFEARESSGLFRFVDDVVVRVRAVGPGSVVDVRSRSRDGRGDLGVNAKRIAAFSEALIR